MTPSLTDSAVKVIIAAIAFQSATTLAKIELLSKMVFSCQKKPKSSQELHQGVLLDQKAALRTQKYSCLRSHALARKGMMLQLIPIEASDFLLQAKDTDEAGFPLWNSHSM